MNAHIEAAEPVTAPTILVVAPVIPADWKRVKQPPAGTEPPKEAIHAAVIPDNVKPIAGSMTDVPNNAVPPTAVRHEALHSVTPLNKWHDQFYLKKYKAYPVKK